MSRWSFSLALALALALGCQRSVVIDIQADAPDFDDCPVLEAPTFEFRPGECGDSVSLQTGFLRIQGGDLVSPGQHCFRATVYSECGEVAVAASEVEVTTQTQQRVELHFAAPDDARDRSCAAMRNNGASLSSLNAVGALTFGASHGCAMTYEDRRVALRCWGPDEFAVRRETDGNVIDAFEVYGANECFAQGRTGMCLDDTRNLWRPEFASATELEASETSLCGIVSSRTRDRLFCTGAANAEAYESTRDPAVRLTGLSVVGDSFCVLEDATRLHCEDAPRSWMPEARDVTTTLELSAASAEMVCVSARRGNRGELYCGTPPSMTERLVDSVEGPPPPPVESLCVGAQGACVVLRGEVLCGREQLVPVRLPGFAIQVACGSTSTCAALRREAGRIEIWCWGANEARELGHARGHAPAEICTTT